MTRPQPPTCLMCSNPVRHTGRWNSWRRFCSRRCCGRWAASRLTPAQRIKAGHEGGAAKRTVYWDRMLGDLLPLEKAQAIYRAYKRGYNAGKRARLEAARKGRAA